MYNSMNFSYTEEWPTAARSRRQPDDMTVDKASIATFLCPSDGVINTGSGDSSRLVSARQLQLRGEHGASAEHPAPGRLRPHSGNLPPLTGIMSMSRMYLGQWRVRDRRQDAQHAT